MKKQYIKFIAGNQDSLDKACKLAEKHGYKKASYGNALNFEFEWLLLCTDAAIYHTTIWAEKVVEKAGYTELKEEPEWVYVSDISKEDALGWQVKRILITTLPGKAVYKYVCIGKWDEEAYLRWDKYNISVWPYAVPVPTEEKKERKLMMTDSEWEKFQKENNI